MCTSLLHFTRLERNSLKMKKNRMTGISELDGIKIEFIILVWEEISHYLATFHIKHLVYIYLYVYKEKDKSHTHLNETK